jgi:mono/diheme cytochrome c family protein
VQSKSANFPVTIRWAAAAVVAGLFCVPAHADTPVDFAHDVLPILRNHCAKCHTNGRYEGDLSLDTREAILKVEAAVPGRSAESKIVERITSDDPDVRMPAEAPPLSTSEIDALRRWIDAGLPWQEGFTFHQEVYLPPLKPRHPDLPPAEAGLDNAVDRIVFAYWKKHGITPLAQVDDAAFYRRVSLDLVGLLPDPAALDKFVADTDPAKRNKLVRQLLDDRIAYADRRRPQADHGLALPIARREQTVRCVCSRVDRAANRVGRFCARHRVARSGERQPET